MHVDTTPVASIIFMPFVSAYVAVVHIFVFISVPGVSTE